jgi:hypothetical protein
MEKSENLNWKRHQEREKYEYIYQEILTEIERPESFLTGTFLRFLI